MSLKKNKKSSYVRCLLEGYTLTQVAVHFGPVFANFAIGSPSLWQLISSSVVCSCESFCSFHYLFTYSLIGIMVSTVVYSILVVWRYLMGFLGIHLVFFGGQSGLCSSVVSFDNKDRCLSWVKQ